MINRKSREDIKRMRHAGHIVALVHKKMREVVEPGISEDVVEFRNHVLHTLSGSFIQRHYSGPAHLIMCTDFEDAPGQTREEAIAHFPVNKANWKEAQPEMPITFVNSVHMQMVHDPENLRIVKQIVDRYAFG